MVKERVVGMMDVAKINPVIQSDKDVTNNAFIVVDGITYLVKNDIHGDDAYKEDVVIKAGEFLNGYDVSAWVGQELIVDGKHITGGIENLDEDSVLVVGDDGKLKVGEASGIGFKVTGKITLTEPAVVVRVFMGE